MENVNIDPSKFQFANQDNFQADKKFETKPIGYFKDAWIRFKRNKGSMVAFIIIIILFLFAIIAPIAGKNNYTSTVNDTDVQRYQKLLPKTHIFEFIGWDGCSNTEININDYNKKIALYKETGLNPLKNVYSKFEVNTENGPVTYYSVRLDSYKNMGMFTTSVTKEEFEAMQKWQNETGVQLIYPVVNLTSSDPKKAAYYKNYSKDANIWYDIDKNGNPIISETGLVPMYFSYDTYDYNSDDYDSLRISSDPGKTDGTSGDRYMYSLPSGKTGYTVRLSQYSFFQYKYGEEPTFIFGTDQYGKDIFTRLGSGARFSFIFAICISLINLTIGAIYGAVEGFFGGTADLIMERISDILGGIPFIVVTTLFQLHMAEKVGALGSLLFAFVTTGWLGMAGTVRMQFYRYKNQEYVLAARTLGASNARLMFKHIFPNALGTIITSCVLVIPGVIFSESSLTYLGIVNLESSNITSVGTLLAHGDGTVTQFPHILLFPAIFISLLMISFNLFGNGLRDAFNPSLRGTED